MISEPDPVGRSRRAFLVGAASWGAGTTGVLLAGCGVPGGRVSARRPAGGTSTPGPGGSPRSASPEPPSVPVFPGSVEGVRLEEAAAARAGALLTVGRKALGKQGRAFVTAVRDQHTAHAAALRATDPTDPGSSGGAPSSAPSGASGSSPSPAPSLAKAVDRLLAAESEAAKSHRATALDSTGLSALLWGSLATSAAALAAVVEDADLAGPEPAPGATAVGRVRARAPMPVLEVVPAEQQMVRQLHAVIYGYQLALGRLSGSRRDIAAAELRRHRMLRDRLTSRLINRKAAVPVAAPAYVPSTTPRNAATAGKLIRQMETALVPFCGLWVAAAETPKELREALDQVGRSGRVARQWGASLPAWPGWKLA